MRGIDLKFCKSGAGRHDQIWIQDLQVGLHVRRIVEDSHAQAPYSIYNIETSSIPQHQQNTTRPRSTQITRYKQTVDNNKLGAFTIWHQQHSRHGQQLPGTATTANLTLTEPCKSLNLIFAFNFQIFTKFNITTHAQSAHFCLSQIPSQNITIGMQYSSRVIKHRPSHSRNQCSYNPPKQSNYPPPHSTQNTSLTTLQKQPSLAPKLQHCSTTPCSHNKQNQNSTIRIQKNLKFQQKTTQPNLKCKIAPIKVTRFGKPKSCPNNTNVCNVHRKTKTIDKHQKHSQYQCNVKPLGAKDFIDKFSTLHSQLQIMQLLQLCPLTLEMYTYTIQTKCRDKQTGTSSKNMRQHHKVLPRTSPRIPILTTTHKVGHEHQEKLKWPRLP